jgi:hypothetical protein
LDHVPSPLAEHDDPTSIQLFHLSRASHMLLSHDAWLMRFLHVHSNTFMSHVACPMPSRLHAAPTRKGVARDDLFKCLLGDLKEEESIICVLRGMAGTIANTHFQTQTTARLTCLSTRNCLIQQELPPLGWSTSGTLPSGSRLKEQTQQCFPAHAISLDVSLNNW